MTQALRDYQHANKFYSAMDFAHAPKTKFLYHVLFTLTPEGQAWSYAMKNHDKEMSVLVKSADLPGYSARIETKKQYNRVKNLQTAIEYDPISIRLHDDNSHITSQLLEDYYTYYFRDGLKRNDDGTVKDYQPRDKYGTRVPFYGLDASPSPFFQHIKIFQLAKKEWRSYTLVNPMIEKWQHDNVDYSAGADIMENTFSVVYESVIYNQGSINDNADPAGFKDQATMYDTTESPIAGRIPGASITRADASSRSVIQDTVSRLRSTQTPSSSGSTYDEAGVAGPNGAFPQRQTTSTNPTLNTESNVRVKNADTLVSQMNQPQNADAKEAFTRRAVQTGAAGVLQEDYDALSDADKDKLGDALLNEAADGNKKLQNIAAESLSGSGNKPQRPELSKSAKVEQDEEAFETAVIGSKPPSERTAEEQAYYEAHTTTVPGKRGQRLSAYEIRTAPISSARKAAALERIDKQKAKYNEGQE